MNEISLIQNLDFKSNSERFEIVVESLRNLDVKAEIQTYNSGKNIVVDLGNCQKRLAIGSHFDRVNTTAGANDNSSSIAVCLKLIEKFRDYPFTTVGLRVFFFDEEEVGLKGSRAYVKSNGLDDLTGFLNLEMVGSGNKFGLWNVSRDYNSELVSLFEKIAKNQGHEVYRFDQIVTNYADHVSFREAGMKNAFSITLISDKDLEVAYHYYKAIESGSDMSTLHQIMAAAPLFQHYHKPTDTYEKISLSALQLVTNTLSEVIRSSIGTIE